MDSLVKKNDPTSYYNTYCNRLNDTIIRQQDDNTLIHDIFIRDDKIYFISTFWSRNFPKIKINIKGVKLSEHAINQQEPMRYFTGFVGIKRKFNLNINGNIHILEPPVIKPLDKKHRFAIATLFKYETVDMVKRFIKYYRSQGCTMFYLYYNGSVLPEDLPKRSDIIYRIWDFTYFLTDLEYIHCAQSVFLTTVRFRHLPDCDFLALIDLDEYIYSLDEGLLLVDYLYSISNDYNVIKIQNHWARCPDLGGPISYTGLGCGFLERTKCIYRGSFKGYFSIHEPKNESDEKVYCTPNLLLLHLTMLHKERDMLIKEPILNSTLTLLPITAKTLST
jgi:hypothetical protein